MTLQVRVENAHPDMSDTRKVRVTTQYRIYAGAPDEHIRTDAWADSTATPPRILTTAQVAELWVYSDQRLIVEEIDEKE